MTSELICSPAAEQNRGLVDGHSALMDEDRGGRGTSGEVKQSDMDYGSAGLLDKDSSRGAIDGEAKQSGMSHETESMGESPGERDNGEEIRSSAMDRESSRTRLPYCRIIMRLTCTYFRS